jgi:aspartate carbamoyltransferase catalytic subunit
MGSQVTLIGPPTLMPPHAETWGVEVTSDLDEVIGKLDVVYLLRVQKERQHEQLLPTDREYSALWGLDRRRAEQLSSQSLIMHPGPMNRGVEIASEVADSDRAIVTDQVTNGVAIRSALLYLMLGESETSSDE